jgi:hypothetical protein
MTTFVPTTFSIEPPDRPDDFGGAVLQSLTRPIGRHAPWGPVKLFILGGLSFGVWPALALPRAWREDASVERNQLWHIAEWLRVRTALPQAAALRDRATPRGFRGPVWLISFAILVSVAAYFVTQWPFRHFDFPGLVQLTYRPISDGEVQFSTVWNVGMGMVFLLHWLQVRWHGKDVRAFVRRFNEISAGSGLGQVQMPRLGWGLSFSWIIGAVVLACINAWWGIPMMMAGAVHRRYVYRISEPTRQQIALNFRGLLLSQRPALNVPLPLRLRPMCTEVRCQSLLPKDAKFCPRCGRRAADGPIDVSA